VPEDRYRELAPTDDPQRLLTCVWTRTVDAESPHELRVVPDACIDVMWHRESGELFLAGPDTEPQVSALEPGTLIGARFAPGAAPPVLGVPADELRNGRIPLDTLWHPARARRLTDALAETTTNTEALRILEHTLTAPNDEARDPVATAVLRLLRSDPQIAHIADEIGLSERQLHRRCLTAFGYGPKVLHRVLRFDRAIRLARKGIPFADIAYRLGYADQAHLAREVKTLAGVPLSTLVGQ
jgi:AraC-like DNA-binding protein